MSGWHANIWSHYNDFIMGTMASQITSLMIVYSTVYWRLRSKKTSKLHVTGLCEGNSPVTGEFPAQRASNAENASIWWCHHGISQYPVDPYTSPWSPKRRVMNYRVTYLLFNVNRPSHSWDMAISKFDFEILRSWPCMRSKIKVTLLAQ